MRYFFTRKVILVKYSYAFIVMPGGAGTMDEMFETMTLIQTGKLKGFPIILMGKDYWQPLMDFVYRMAEEGTISPDDPELIFFTDDVEDAVAHLQRHAVRQFGLRKKRVPQPIRALGEKPIGRLGLRQEEAALFFRDRHPEFLHDREHVLPELALDGSCCRRFATDNSDDRSPAPGCRRTHAIFRASNRPSGELLTSPPRRCRRGRRCTRASRSRPPRGRRACRRPFPRAWACGCWSSGAAWPGGT